MRTTPDEHTSRRGQETTPGERERDLSHDNPRRQREPREEPEDDGRQRSSPSRPGVSPD
jgi:hypothetical protein